MATSASPNGHMEALHGRLWRQRSSKDSDRVGLQRQKSLIHDSADDHVKSLSNPQSFCKTSTVHGLRFWPAYPLQPRGWIVVRLFWVLLTLTSLGMVAYFTYDAINKYLAYKTTTYYSTRRSGGLPFPSITICNFNPLRSSDVFAGYSDDSGNLTGLPNLYLLCSVYNLGKDEFPACFEPDEVKKFSNDNRTLNDIYLQYGPRKHETIPDIGPPAWFDYACKYSGSRCSSENFTHSTTEYGNCFTFNGGENSTLLSRSQGKSSGLDVILNVEQQEYFSRGVTAVGLAVFLHPPHQPVSANHGAIAIKPGTENYIAVRAVKATRLPDPYNGPDFCVSEAEGRHIMQYYPDYSLLGCKKECVTRYVFSKCNCILPEMPPLMTNGQVMQQCKLLEAVECGEVQRAEFERDHEAQERLCQVCQEPCNEKGYQYTFTHSSANFLEYSNAVHMDDALLDQNIDISPFLYDEDEELSDANLLVAIRESLLKLVVYFDDLDFEERKELPAYELVSLLGDIGGNLGLFLGASFLTVFELLQFFLAYTHQAVHFSCSVRGQDDIQEYDTELATWSRGTTEKPALTYVPSDTDDNIALVPGDDDKPK